MPEAAAARIVPRKALSSAHAQCGNTSQKLAWPKPDQLDHLLRPCSGSAWLTGVTQWYVYIQLCIYIIYVTPFPCVCGCACAVVKGWMCTCAWTVKKTHVQVSTDIRRNVVLSCSMLCSGALPNVCVWSAPPSSPFTSLQVRGVPFNKREVQVDKLRTYTYPLLLLSPSI